MVAPRPRSDRRQRVLNFGDCELISGKGEFLSFTGEYYSTSPPVRIAGDVRRKYTL